MQPGNKRLVLVTGAAGFIGKDVVAHLMRCGWRVRAMVRSRNPFSPAPDVECVTADMRDATSVRQAVQGIHAVVHLAAAKADEKDSEDVNVRGAHRLVDACRAAGCARIINVSTQSVKIPRKGDYARTKAAADEVFHNSSLAVTTLLPSVVYGEEKSGVFGTVLGFIQKLPVIPVLGDGKWVSAPIYVGDVSKAIVACLENDVTVGKRYDLGGPDHVRFDDLIDRLAAARGLRRPKVHVPFGVALLIARTAVRLLPRPPITVSNVLGSNQATAIDIAPAQRDFGFHPIDLDTGLKKVLGAVPATDTNEELAREAVVLARYLLNVDPPVELQQRYVAAHRKLLGDSAVPEARFIHRHPRLLPFVDAAAGLIQPDSVVRRKLCVMAAVLETTPVYANFFLKKPEPPLRLLRGVAWQAVRSAAKITIGIPIFLVARRDR